ncbi:MAG: hypothetical protein AAB556_01455 [Patescibacteria group bacterium]|mgnify:CR=1 FL=1
MAEIIPSINVDNFEELSRRIKLVEPYVDWVHIDVSDGTFTDHVSWHESKDLIGFETKVKIEVHLMVDRPEKKIASWLLTPAARLIFHQEATKNHELVIEKIHEAKREAGIAIRPDTPWLKLFPYFGKVELLQVLAVSPGPSGQALSEEAIHKIGHIKHTCHPCIIEVDGGVNLQNAQILTKEGADILVVGKAIFEAENLKGAIDELKTLSNQVAK